MDRVRIVSFTENGYQLFCRIRKVIGDRAAVTGYSGRSQVAETHPDIYPVTEGLQAWCETVFEQSEVLIFIGACGIAVRTIAPFLDSKYTDPAVLVADEQGGHVISLLSGHLGGANAWTQFLAEGLQADPVITTASDVNGRLAVDVWAVRHGLQITDRTLAKYAAAVFVTGEPLPFYAEPGYVDIAALPEEFNRFEAKEAFWNAAERRKQEQIAGIVVSVHSGWQTNVLRLVPQRVVLGIGCRRDKDPEELAQQVDRVLAQYQITPESICKIASIDLKTHERAICQLAETWKVPFVTFSAETLLQMPGAYALSDFVKQTTGVGNVCERAAVAALEEQERKNPKWICRKQAGNGVTVALLET
nr:cobalt-precorrin 5A hydrolase [Eubacterium ramulus]